MHPVAGGVLAVIVPGGQNLVDQRGQRAALQLEVDEAGLGHRDGLGLGQQLPELVHDGGGDIHGALVQRLGQLHGRAGGVVAQLGVPGDLHRQHVGGGLQAVDLLKCLAHRVENFLFKIAHKAFASISLLSGRPCGPFFSHALFPQQQLLKVPAQRLGGGVVPDDEQDGVVAGDAAHQALLLQLVGEGAHRVGQPGHGFDDDDVARRVDGQGGQPRDVQQLPNVVAHGGHGLHPVADAAAGIGELHQVQRVNVPGQGGLGALHPPGGQQLQQLLLGGHALPGDQLQNQLLPVCFHRFFLPAPARKTIDRPERSS